MVGSKVASASILIAIFLFSVQSPIYLQDIQANETNGRSQTTWSGEVVLNNHYTIPVTDELVVSACTNVTMANGVRIYVEGRITVEGTLHVLYTSIMLVGTIWEFNSIPPRITEGAR